MGFLQLNPDIFLLIVEYLDCYDALHLSEVARPVHLVAKYQALKSVVIHNHLTMAKFSRYMLEHMSHRIPHLRSIKALLQFAPSQQDQWFSAGSKWGRHFRQVRDLHAAGSIFADLLERATNLKSFRLAPAEFWMDYEPRIASALASLRQLQDVHLIDIRPMVALVLNNLQSKPEELVLMEGESTNPRLMQSQFPLNKDLCLPSVRHLTAWGDRALPFFTRFASICPNLRTLDLGSSWSTERFPPDYTGDEEPARWQHLESVHGLPDALEELPTAAPVHCIRLTSSAVSTQARARLMVVHSAQPVSLSVAITPDDEADFFGRVVRASPRLRHLCLLLLNWTSSLSPFMVSASRRAFASVWLSARSGSDRTDACRVECGLPRAALRSPWPAGVAQQPRGV